MLADEILAAIAVHRSAYEAFQVAPGPDDSAESLDAEEAYSAATYQLVAVPCRCRRGAAALLAHLRWWIADEAEFATSYQPAYGFAQARAADLALFLTELTQC